ncbi:transmembrane protein, putative (macronuclear) [Tetrahymena thermophila SB210]|uniref:Transmembrane protein, putative n=1 Tax=Tetrahymena thermophila (strain SB210) TaxID=312017 RepID=W7XDI2_TETTS|nr:transmembrane protein, putative [Tetrahymena thermophila SB210]EWS74703.1 transmembrane protein, putative [Tetrahymena thermophila SB210]|eukprot:XP_012652704.1 transmembrane protein, putative [Tetrahymena thermophila SB210]
MTNFQFKAQVKNDKDQFQIDFNNNYYGLLYAENLTQIVIEETQLKNAFAINQGGCLYLSNKYDQLKQTFITLRNSYFYNFYSTYFGGCIYGGQIALIENAEFKYCSSYVGGALYISNQSDQDELNKITFEENKAELYGHNYSFYIQDIFVTKVYEYNPQNELYSRSLVQNK